MVEAFNRVRREERKKVEQSIEGIFSARFQREYGYGEFWCHPIQCSIYFIPRARESASSRSSHRVVCRV